jgi:chromosomal replication initiator protein
MIDAVAEVWGVSRAAILSKVRTPELVEPRHVAVYLLVSACHLGFVRTGQALGYRDHTTAIHAHRKIRRILDDERAMPPMRQLVTPLVHSAWETFVCHQREARDARSNT